MDGGVVNHMWKVWPSKDTQDKGRGKVVGEDEDVEDKEEERKEGKEESDKSAMVVKIFGSGKGQGTETPYTVEEEHNLMEELNEYNLTPPLIAL